MGRPTVRTWVLARQLERTLDPVPCETTEGALALVGFCYRTLQETPVAEGKTAKDLLGDGDLKGVISIVGQWLAGRASSSQLESAAETARLVASRITGERVLAATGAGAAAWAVAHLAEAAFNACGATALLTGRASLQGEETDFLGEVAFHVKWAVAAIQRASADGWEVETLRDQIRLASEIWPAASVVGGTEEDQGVRRE